MIRSGCGYPGHEVIVDGVDVVEELGAEEEELVEEGGEGGREEGAGRYWKMRRRRRRRRGRGRVRCKEDN